MRQITRLLATVVLSSTMALVVSVDALQTKEIQPPSSELLKKYPPVAVARTRYDTLIKEQASHLSRVLKRAPGGTKLYVVGRERSFLKVLLRQRIGYVADTQVEILSGRKL